MANILIFGLCVLVAYMAYFIIRYGIPESFSKTFYAIGEKAFFTIILWGISLPVIIVTDSVLLWGAGASVIFVSIAPDFKDPNLESKIHFWCSYISVFLASLAYIFEFGLWYIGGPMLALAIIIKLFWKFKNHVLWIELAYMVSTYVIVFIFDILRA